MKVNKAARAALKIPQKKDGQWGETFMRYTRGDLVRFTGAGILGRQIVRTKRAHDLMIKEGARVKAARGKPKKRTRRRSSFDSSGIFGF